MEKRELSQQEVNKAREAYEGCIRYIDNQIGELLTALKARSLLDNTIVIVTADHGELFGEHDLFGHGNCLYRPVIQVPLLISFPSNLPRDRKIKHPVSLRDLPATLMDLIGYRGDHPFPGPSMARYWRQDAEQDSPPEYLLSELATPSRIPPDQGRSPISNGPMKSLIVNGKQYIRNLGDGSEEFYDFARDPGETRDLSQVVECQEDLRQSRNSLRILLSGIGH